MHSTGAYGFLRPDKVQERQQGAALDPELQPKKGSDKQVYYRKDPAAPNPIVETDAVDRAQALQGDQWFSDGILHTSDAHSCQQTGILCSHVSIKLIYWDDEACRSPACMHCSYNEVHSICDMICGGTGTPAIYTAKRLAHVADYEVHVNSRFVSELQRFVSEARQAGEVWRARTYCSVCTCMLHGLRQHVAMIACMCSHIHSMLHGVSLVEHNRLLGLHQRLLTCVHSAPAPLMLC